jgi:hypothetical protein
MKISMTKQDLIRVLRVHYSVQDIDDFELLNDSGDWIDVPEDWQQDVCPDKEMYYANLEIEVLCRDGVIEKIKARDYNESWIQENDKLDFVKYRKAK